MKLNGKTPTKNVVTLVLPRNEGGDIVLKAQALTDLSEFERLCPQPVPPKIRTKKSGLIDNYEDDGYKIAIQQRSDQQYAFIMIKSLEATEGLVWETIQLGDPTTYANWTKELGEAGFSVWELGRIKTTVLEANSLNESKLEAARESFLAETVEVE